MKSMQQLRALSVSRCHVLTQLSNFLMTLRRDVCGGGGVEAFLCVTKKCSVHTKRQLKRVFSFVFSGRGTKDQSNKPLVFYILIRWSS